MASESSETVGRGTSRRGVLLGLLGVPAAVLAGSLGVRLRGRAALVRPVGAGTSSQRCGACGSSGHTMLSAVCQAAPKVV